MESAGLTPRQSEILTYVLMGHTNKSIGNSLGITEWTVKAHLKPIFNKLNVKNRTQLVAQVAESSSGRKNEILLEKLTVMEFEVVRRVAEGKINREIASECGLTKRTVDTYCRTIFRKLKVKNRTEAAALVAGVI